MSRRILVVDDDRAMVATLLDVLSLHGWEAVGAYDGEEAVALAGRESMDVVLMDIRMPRLDGVAALRAIKRAHPGTRVMLMTAHAAQDLLAQAEREGVLRILRKPVALDQLLPLLERAAAGRKPVLVVDDDPAFLHTLCDVLGGRGLPTMQATSFDAAIEQLASGGPGAVLLDLRLDHLDPRECLLTIRERNPSVLLVLYSGHQSDLAEVVQKAPPGVIDAAFTKPLPIEHLLELLNAPRDC
jgi:DNA-binding NtrC family response regulator